MRAPVLVFGAPFSGVSLLSQMLGGHGDLYSTPVLHLALADTVGTLLDLFSLSQLPIADGLLRLVAQRFTGGQDAAGVAAAHHWLTQRRDWTTAALLSHLADDVAPRRLVIPDHESALRPDELGRWQQMAPQAMLIQPLRHPLTHGAVWAPRLERQLFVPPDYRDHRSAPAAALIEPQLPWLRVNHMLEHWWPTQRRHVLRMEDLAADPDATLSAALAALGLAASEADLQRMRAVEGSDFAGAGPPEAAGGLEEEVLLDVLETAYRLKQGPPSLDDRVPWQRDRDARLTPEVIAQAQRYGYR